MKMIMEMMIKLIISWLVLLQIYHLIQKKLKLNQLNQMIIIINNNSNTIKTNSHGNNNLTASNGINNKKISSEPNKNKKLMKPTKPGKLGKPGKLNKIKPSNVDENIVHEQLENAFVTVALMTNKEFLEQIALDGRNFPFKHFKSDYLIDRQEILRQIPDMINILINKI